MNAKTTPEAVVQELEGEIKRTAYKFAMNALRDTPLDAALLVIEQRIKAGANAAKKCPGGSLEAEVLSTARDLVKVRDALVQARNRKTIF